MIAGDLEARGSRKSAGNWGYQALSTAMGCFSISAHKARKKIVVMDHSRLPAPKSASLFLNKPTVLPDPCEVEQSRSYTRTLSSSFHFINARKCQTSNSHSIFESPRALSAPDRLHMLDSYSHSKVALAEHAQPSSSPLRNRIQPLFDLSSCQKADMIAFAGRPVPLPTPHLPSLSGHPLPSIPFSSVCLIKGQQLGSSQCSAAATSRQGNAQVLRVSSSLEPRPLPPPPDETGFALSPPRLFTLSELAAACENFSPAFCAQRDTGAGVIYRSWILDKQSTRKRTEVSIVQISSSAFLQGSNEFTAEAKRLSSVRHPNLCKFIGFCIEDASQVTRTAMKHKVHHLVYERLPNGSADELLYRKQEGAPLDWPIRLKIALGTAKALNYLHEHPSGQILCRCLNTVNIELDQDFSAKLSGYGFATQNSFEFCSSVKAKTHIPPETAAEGYVTPKSNVYSLGIVMLELLSARSKTMITASPSEHQNIVKWAANFTNNDDDDGDDDDDFMGMDPALEGSRCSAELKSFARLALKCVNIEPDLRPSMREVCESLESLQLTAV